MPDDAPADIDALGDLCTPWCIHTAVTLRIAEHIAGGVTGIDGIARAVGCDAEALNRMLSWLVAKGVFEEPSPGCFSLNEAARALMEPARRIGMDLGGIGGRMAYAWGTMPTYVRTGAPGYAEMFGLPFWEDLDAHPALAASFDDLIGQIGHGTPSVAFQPQGGWEGVHTVVDVGGGTGVFLAELLRVHPALTGTLVDLPRTVARAEAAFGSAGVAARVSTIGQSFFDPLPGGADLYLLKNVINDWPDAEAVAILTRCAEAARPRGRVIILAGIDAYEASRPLSPEMVLAGGKHRTLTELQTIAGRAGLEVLAAAQQPPRYFVVECRPI
ncbi:MAG: hydroxyneurosporene methyltransferase [Armatimonadetes bacterium]|nr:hydroxyneurosporene methyltransferase [Armatimonadota bacterium]MDE2205930.1 hydroxyneurosporene methyltransferase [Armatimonadota bacterium]